MKASLILTEIFANKILFFYTIDKYRIQFLIVRKVKERCRGRLCPFGNVNNKTTMVSGSTEDVRKEVLECLMTGAPGGGYVIAADHSLHDDIPLENMYAFMDTVKKYGIYPLDFEK